MGCRNRSSVPFIMVYSTSHGAFYVNIKMLFGPLSSNVVQRATRQTNHPNGFELYFSHRYAGPMLSNREGLAMNDGNNNNNTNKYVHKIPLTRYTQIQSIKSVNCAFLFKGLFSSGYIYLLVINLRFEYEKNDRKKLCRNELCDGKLSSINEFSVFCNIAHSYFLSPPLVLWFNSYKMGYGCACMCIWCIQQHNLSDVYCIVLCEEWILFFLPFIEIGRYNLNVILIVCWSRHLKLKLNRND